MTQAHDRPNNARMVDYILGGSHHFAVDRAAADAVLPLFPDGPELVRAQRRFLQRATSWMAEERGIRRFLDFGSGLPTNGNTHEVAHEIDAQAQVVYTDRDPLTVTYAQQILAATPGVQFIQVDVTDLDQLLAQPAVAALPAGDAPVGLVMVGIAMYIPPATLTAMLARLHAWAPSGSALALVLAAPEAETHPGIQLYRQQGFPWYGQTREEVAACLGPWRTTDDGVIHGLSWRAPSTPDAATFMMNWALVATR